MPYVGCFISSPRADSSFPLVIIHRTPVDEAVPDELHPTLKIGAFEARNPGDWPLDLCAEMLALDAFHESLEGRPALACGEWTPLFARVHFDAARSHFRLTARLDLIEAHGGLSGLISAFELSEHQDLLQIEVDEEDLPVLLERAELPRDAPNPADLIHYTVIAGNPGRVVVTRRTNHRSR
jgi:hypothetical protein